MINCKKSEEGRRAIWAYTFDEITEVIELIQWTYQSSSDEGIQRSSKNSVSSAYGRRLIPEAVRHHMQQLLAVKLESIFGKRGGGSEETGKEVFENGILGKVWWTPMKSFADSNLENPNEIRSLLKRLHVERNQMIAHREGKIADITHKPDNLLEFRANPTPPTAEEFVSIHKYIKSCKYFCEQAQDNGNGPRLSELAKMAWPNSEPNY